MMLSDVLAVERLHPLRLSKQTDVIDGLMQEWDWLQQMLAQRGGEGAPADGWVRHVPLVEAAVSPRAWQEMGMVLMLSNWQTAMLGRIGSDCDSYEQLYQQWLDARQLSPAQRLQLTATLQAWPRQPRINVLIADPQAEPEMLRQTLQSLDHQLYPAHSCLVLSSQPQHQPGVRSMPLQADWPAQLNALVEACGVDEWVYLLRAGDRLSESALLVLAERIAVLPRLACVYSDEGAWIDGQPCEPVFKPDFNIDLMRSYPYVGRALAFSCEALRVAGGFDSAFGELAPHDLLWRLVERHGPQVIEHIAELQLQSQQSFAQWLAQDAVACNSLRVVAAHLQRMGVAHRMEPEPLPVLNRVHYLHAEQPLVSIIVNCGDDLLTLQRCVMSIMELTRYPRYELLLVTADNVQPAVAAWLEAMAEVGSAILRVLGPGLGCDAVELVNAASVHAHGSYLVMVDAGLHVTEGQWLDELLEQAQRPEVAVVGGRVLNCFGKVVHAGMVLGVNDAVGPVCAGEDGLGRGYLQRLQVVQNWSAVAGACMMVRRAVFDELGGLDAQQFSSGLAPIDLCLRAGRQGYLVVWTPHATLHSQAQAPLQASSADRADEEDAFCERWLPAVARDPAYNPNLNLMLANFSLDPGQRAAWNPFCARAVPSVLALPVNASAVGQYRVIQPLRELEVAGHVIGRLAYEMPSTVQLARLDPDVIVVQLRHSESGGRDIARLARFSNARRIYEIDDYVVDTPKKNTHARNKPSDIEQHLRRCISLCDRVVVTTQALADVLSDMHQDIRVVPNMLDPQLWAALKGRRGTSKKPRVGWGGGTSHSGDLEVIADVVRELAGEVEWVFFGMCPPALRPYVHEFHPLVGLQAYPAKLASLNLDLALAPLEFHVFNDCKSNLRLLEYGACGYPVICTDTAAYRGHLPCTRVFSNSTREWVDAIRMHLRDPDASYRLGDELRETVHRNFMLQANSLQHWQWGWLAD
ncbi:glycosyltransferase [Pseudomonas sp. LRP2-20]|nr:glycosyltransferase [Pseudomonas sp. LRP2-20]